MMLHSSRVKRSPISVLMVILTFPCVASCGTPRGAGDAQRAISILTPLVEAHSTAAEIEQALAKSGFQCVTAPRESFRGGQPEILRGSVVSNPSGVLLLVEEIGDVERTLFVRSSFHLCVEFSVDGRATSLQLYREWIERWYPYRVRESAGSKRG